MNASSSTSAAMATMIALYTKADASSLCNISEPDAIAESKTGLLAALRSLLERAVSGNVLKSGKAKTQATPIGSRCEAPNLIYLRKILRAHREKRISDEFSFRPVPQGNTQPSLAGRLPVNIGVGEMAARFGQAHG